MIPSPLPTDLKTGILHLGLGAFHRAHQADFTQDAIAASGGDWGIEAVSMRNPALAETLTRQGGRFTLIERTPNGPVLKDMTVIRRAHALPGHERAVAARMADPAIHVVTITVTEKGYAADHGRQCLDMADVGLRHDWAAPDAPPRSLVGVICHGLALRRAAGLGGLTLMSCDNLPENGRVLRAITVQFARHVDPALASWIETSCTFPSSMVDRITPAASDDTRAIAGGDAAAVETEPFRQWVIEDSFAGPHPDWAAAGALITRDVRPFETMKLRLLNGAHSFLAYGGALLGLDMVRDVMADADLSRAVRWHMNSVAGSFDAPHGFDVDGYIDDLIERFRNPAMAHRCLQIASDGSQKMPQRILAPALDLAGRGQGFYSCAMAMAAWLIFLERHQADAAPPLQDPLSVQLLDMVRGANGHDAVLLDRLGTVLGVTAESLWAQDTWQKAVLGACADIRQLGFREAARSAMGLR